MLNNQLSDELTQFQPTSGIIVFLMKLLQAQVIKKYFRPCVEQEVSLTHSH